MMIVALAIGGCAKGESGEHAQEAAARADSSAAGYTVGVPPDSAGAPRIDSTPSPASAAASASGAGAGARPAAASAAATSRAAEVPPPDTAARSGRKLPPAVTRPAQTPPVRRVPDTPRSEGATAAIAARGVRVNEFLSYDADARTAILQVVGGYNGLNGALNFNGGAKGSQTITVPLGWKVQASFVNRDGDLPHSAIVVREVSPIPLESPPAAFPRAFTVKLEEGLQEGGADDMSFVANKEGRFLIFCGVPGHGQGGMWIYLVVSPSASAPSYQ
jgi:sulfocyanin